MSEEIRPFEVLNVGTKFKDSEHTRRRSRHYKFEDFKRKRSFARVSSGTNWGDGIAEFVLALKSQDDQVKMLFAVLHKIVRAQAMLALEADGQAKVRKAIEQNKISPPARNQAGWSTR